MQAMSDMFGTSPRKAASGSEARSPRPDQPDVQEGRGFPSPKGVTKEGMTPLEVGTQNILSVRAARSYAVTKQSTFSRREIFCRVSCLTFKDL